MSERKEVYYTFQDVVEYRTLGHLVNEIIQKDTGEEAWMESRSLPPIGYPPPLTLDAIERLKALDGVIVNDK